MTSLAKRIFGESGIIDKDYISDFSKSFYEYSLEQRKKESQRALAKHPNKVPCLLFKGTEDTPDSKNHKYLLPKEMLVTEFMTVIRNYVKLAPDQAIFLFVGDSIPRATSTIEELYRDYKSDDGYLKITYTIESTFG